MKLLALGIKKELVSFVLPSFFRNFANKMANLLRLGKKKEMTFFCFALDFS